MDHHLLLLVILMLFIAPVARSAFLRPALQAPSTFFSCSKVARPVVSLSESTLFSSRNENTEAENLAKDCQEEEWRSALVLSSQPACLSGKSTVIQIEIDDTTRQQYTVPGQFVQFRWNESTEPIFLAMSSAPSSPTMEFLIKMAPRLTWLPEALVTGNTVQISRVMGTGFPIEDAQLGHDNKVDILDQLILAAAGSGIAPLKACIESGQLPPSQQTTLYYGEWTERDECFTDLHESWRHSLGINIVPVLSRTDDSRGYIQQVLQQDGLVSPESTSAVLCGMDDMVQSCTSVLTNAGVDKDRILLNL